ncbi:MAG: hypothetical protein PHV82_14315 [Victivallaceae bacterium]|nr:hypothetical protein [Victivallaceae bacterium]
MSIKLGTFKIDVTPEIGAPISYGINRKVDSSIFIRGVIIDDSEKRIVLVACDFIYIWGGAYGQIKELTAQAAGTVADNVFLHSIHQHDSVRIALELNEAYKRYRGMEITPLAYYRKIREDLAKAVAQTSTELKPVKKLAAAERRIGGLASNRRLVGADGKVYAMRYSMCHDPELQRQPTGLIDPLLRSIGFIGADDKPLAILHFYASHPMTAYKRNMLSADVPGAALDYVTEQYGPDTFQMYFTGCGGNITFGKYSLEDKAASLNMLGERLGRELLANCNRLDLREPGEIVVKHSSFELPLKPELNEKDLLKKLTETVNPNEAILLSTRLEMVRNWEQWKNLVISRISIGDDIHLLSMPSETVVEYQLYAQSLIPEKFLACAAYANSSYGYIPTAAMYEEGGYEPEYGAVTTAVAEEKMKKAIYEVIRELR